MRCRPRDSSSAPMAVPISHTRSAEDTAFDLRSPRNSDAKIRIGKAAALSIKPGQTMLLNSGTTTIEIARHLPENADITVVTPALNIALEAGARAGVEVLVCGGRLNPRTLSTTAHEIGRSFSEIFADRLFLATYGVDVEKGLAERSVEVAETKRALIRAAREITLVCDSSKFGSAGPILISPLNVVSRVITDDRIPPADLAWLRSARIAVELV